MNPLDPTVAALRCWEHEDCLEHPALALACAGGHATLWASGCADDYDCRLAPNNAADENEAWGDGLGPDGGFHRGDGWGAGRDHAYFHFSRAGSSAGIVLDEPPTWINEDRREDWEINATLELELDRLGW